MTEREFAGNVTFGESVRVTDPCYKIDTWCAGTVAGVLAGIYRCYITWSDEGSWGERVSMIEAVHTKHHIDNVRWETIPLDIGVDSGQCGIFDLQYFKDNNGNEDWYWRNCAMTEYNKETGRMGGGVIDGKGFVTSSGYGDGCYECQIAKNDKDEIIGIRVIFICDDEDDFLIDDEEDLDKNDE